MEQKLLYIASTYSHIRNFHLPYIREFQARGWEVHVACGGARMEIPEADQVIHIPFDKSISFSKNQEALRLLRQTLRAGGYELVSTHTALASFFARLAVLGMKNRPLVACMVHGYLFDEETPMKRKLALSMAERLTAPVTDLVMTMNRWDHLYASSHHLGKQVCNAPGVGVNFDRLDQTPETARAELRQELGLSEDQFAFIYAAEFSDRKNQETLLRAMAELPEQAVLLLPGSGAKKAACEALAKQLGLGDRVRFPGQITDMNRWYAAADGAVSSSRSEGLPFNIMEAMHCGLPIVASAVKGHEDLIETEENGLLYPFGDSKACAWQMKRILEESALRSRLGEEARQDAEQYRLERVLPQVMDCYARILPSLSERAEAARTH